MFRKSIAPITAGVLLALAGSAQAATKTAQINVSATVVANCFITAAPIAFGNYDGTAAIDSNANIVVRCSKNAPFSVALDAGTTAGASLAQRLLAGPAGELLRYNLYTTAAQATVWGNNAGGTGWNAGTGAGLGVANQFTYTVYGNLPNTAANQGAGIGAYTDLVTATITY